MMVLLVTDHSDHSDDHVMVIMIIIGHRKCIRHGCSGHVLAMYRACLGHVQDMLGTCSGHVWDMFGTCSGHMLLTVIASSQLQKANKKLCGLMTHRVGILGTPSICCYLQCLQANGVETDGCLSTMSTPWRTLRNAWNRK